MLPDEMRTLRKRTGMSQTEVGERIGVSCATVSNWENGKGEPNPEQAAALENLLAPGGESEGVADYSPVAAWLTSTRVSMGLSVPELADQSGVSMPAIYRIEAGVTRNLRVKTRMKLEKALGRMPEDTAEEAAEDAAIVGLGSLEDFDPHADDERPTQSGIYVLYDISERPIYVGEGSNVRKRIRDHEDKFWFKRPIVETASWIQVDNNDLRKQIEAILIKFLKSNAVINKQHVVR